MSKKRSPRISALNRLVVDPVAEADWTPALRAMAEYACGLSERLLEVPLSFAYDRSAADGSLGFAIDYSLKGEPVPALVMAPKSAERGFYQYAYGSTLDYYLLKCFGKYLALVRQTDEGDACAFLAAKLKAVVKSDAAWFARMDAELPLAA